MLESRTCQPCQGGMPPLTQEEVMNMLADIPGWEAIDGYKKLMRRFTFGNYVEAEHFAMEVGEISEREGHHPVVSYTWGWCEIVFYTHKIGGLHENDFIMAAKVSRLND